LSPFGGIDDDQTSENIKRCELKFPSDAFAGISEHGLDFIKKLLVKNKMARINVFEALEHPWLAEPDTGDAAQLASAKYDSIRAKIKSKYATWPEPNPALGRMANFSSLRKHRPKEYSIYSTYFDRRDANPRFVRKPRNQNVAEGQTATFSCIILAVSPPVVSWWQSGQEIKQSTKYMKKYNRNSYIMEVKRCTLDDRGEFICRAVNSYGEREYNVFLNVERKLTFFFKFFI
jgi:serine/threonine protein kinase